MTSRSDESAFTPLDALAVLVAVVPLALLGTAAFAAGGLASVVLVQLLCIGGPAIALAVIRGGSLPRRLGLIAPSALSLAGAVLVGATLWYLNQRFVAPIVDWLFGHAQEPGPGPPAWSHADPLWQRVLAFAVTAGVCEELVFRGVVARALRPTLGSAGAIVLSAVLFGLFHLSPIRFLPTTLLGAVLAFATLRTGSIVPSILIHVLNNAIPLIVFDARGGGAHILARSISFGVLMALGFLAGMLLLGRGQGSAQSRVRG